ncbi:uncharacterized protein LOC141686143 [Apium graveolens]|uniref:uncharacterized protein LOC141686143 n=1 Tax=Apium graveolens TaxID=4045 RepID=UPI003D7ADB19
MLGLLKTTFSIWHDETYTRWIWHGEANSAESSLPDESDSSVSLNQAYTGMGEADEDDDDDFSSDSSDFMNHVKGEHAPLYPGCENYTKMKALVKLYNLKVKHGMSNSCFSDVLLLIGDLLPEGNNIPSSFSEAKKTLCALGMGYEKIHACPNNCLLYRGQINEDEITCRICKASRWKLNKKGEEQEGVLAKVLWYFPLIPRIINLFNTPQIAKDMTWHDTERQKDGPTEPGNDIDVFLQPLIEDLQQLWLGKQVYDAYKRDSFLLRGILLWTISDYPALGNLPGNVIKGYNACTVCVDNTKATRLVHYRKTVVMRHRRWLPRYHPYRKQKTAFDNTVEKDVAPIPLIGEQVFGRVQHLRDHVFGKTQRQPRWKKGEARPVWKKVSIFFQLEYWKFLPVRHVLDVMHIEKNICEFLLGTLLNIPGKTKDRESVRLDMADMGIRTELRPKTPGKKENVPLASWNLSNAKNKVVCSSFLQMKLPDGFCSNIKNLVNMEKLRLGGMKSHDCHTILHHLLPISIRKVIDVDKLEKMQSELVEILCQLDKHFPPSFFDVMIHLSVHLVREVKLCGPIFLRWMYPFERYMKAFKGYVRNPAHLEGCIAEAYVAEEAVECLVNFDEATIGLPENVRHEQNGISRPLSGATIIKPSKEDFEHMASLMIATELLQEDNTIGDEIRWIAEGPNKNVSTFSGYRINGVSYSTKDRDDNRQVQCSGVSVVADTLMLVEKDKTVEQTAHTYYGVITSIWELDYNNFRVPIFRCNWVDINKGVKVDDLGFILVNLNKLGFVNDPFVLGKHVKQVCYINDPLEKFWSVVLKLPEKNFHDHCDEENDGSVEVELENDLYLPLFPNVDEYDDENTSYMREEEEWIQLP